MSKETSRSKIGRNDPCACGSGKKYKKCCLGKVEEARARARAAEAEQGHVHGPGCNHDH